MVVSNLEIIPSFEGFGFPINVVKEIAVSKQGVNKVILVGNVGQTPELRYLPNGTAALQFSVATTESWKDKQTQEWKDQTEWHRVVAYRKLAEYLGSALKSGSKVYLEGRLRTRKWKDAQGADRNITEIQLDEVRLLDSRKSSREEAPQSQNGEGVALDPRSAGKERKEQEAFAASPFDPLDLEEDIPF